MAEENKEQKPEQTPEQGEEPVQGEGPEQGEEPAQEPEEAPQEEEPKKKEGLLMPFLYALLAGVGAFTLVLIIWIAVTFLINYILQPFEPPPEQPSSEVTLAPTSARTPVEDAVDIFESKPI